MKRKFLACAVALAAIVGSYNALAQSSAQPVLPGALSTTGCNTGLTVCFVAYPVDSNGYPYVDVGGGTGTVSVTATAGAFADGWNLTLGQKSDLQSPWNLTSAGTEMQAIAAIAIAANNPLRYTSTLGGTLTTGSTSGVFVTALVASSNARNGCSFQNTSASMEYVSFQATPTTGGSFQVAAGQSINCATGAMGVLQDKISVAPSTNGAQTFVLYYQGN